VCRGAAAAASGRGSKRADRVREGFEYGIYAAIGMREVGTRNVRRRRKRMNGMRRRRSIVTVQEEERRWRRRRRRRSNLRALHKYKREEGQMIATAEWSSSALCWRVSDKAFGRCVVAELVAAVVS